MGIVHYFKQISEFMLACQTSAGWKSFTMQLQLTLSSPKILFCHSWDESPASFAFAFLSEKRKISEFSSLQKKIEVG